MSVCDFADAESRPELAVAAELPKGMIVKTCRVERARGTMIRVGYFRRTGDTSEALLKDRFDDYYEEGRLFDREVALVKSIAASLR